MKKKPLEICLEKADQLGHKLILAYDKGRNGAKAYESYEKFKDYEKSNFENSQLIDYHYYEILRPDQPRYFQIDIDGKKSQEDLACELIKWFGEPSEVCQANNQKKISYHAVYKDRLFRNLEECQRYVESLEIPDYLESLFDRSIYHKNRLMRMLYQSKKGSNRRLMPVKGYSKKIEDHLAGYYGPEEEGNFYDVTDLRKVKLKLSKTGKAIHQNHQMDIVKEPRLQDEQKLWFDEKQMDDPLYLLKCIPNSRERRQPYNFWIQIGMCLNKCSYDSGKIWKYFEAWVQWTLQSEETVDRAQWKYLWDYFNPRHRCAVGFTTLRKHALYYQPHLINAISPERKFLSEFIDLAISNEMDTDYYSERYVKPYPENVATLIEQSQMGTGKTYQIVKSLINLFENSSKARVLFLSSRITFATNICAEINEELKQAGCEQRIYNYKLAKKPHELFDQQVLMISIESLWKIDVVEPFDLIIIDESESCLKSFSSETMKNIVEVSQAFEKHIESCKRLIVCDAFISNRSLNLTKMRPGKSLLRINGFQSLARHAMEFPYNPHDRNGTKIIEKIVSLAKEGNRLYIVCAYRDKQANGIAGYLENLGISYLLYHGNNSNHHKKTLTNVKKSWAEVQVVITTPTITVGIDYSPEDSKDYFDYVFILSGNYGASPRDLFQGMMRARQIKTKTLYYWISKKRLKPEMNRREMFTIQEIKSHVDNLSKWQTPFLVYNLKHKTETIIEDETGIYKEKSRDDETPDWLLDIFCINQLEDNLSGYKQRPLFMYYLKQTGHSIEILHDLPIGDIPEWIDVQESYGCYNNIPEISESESKIINEKIITCDATAKDKEQYVKYYFNQYFKPEVLKDGYWDEIYKWPQQRQRFHLLEGENHGLLDIKNQMKKEELRLSIQKSNVAKIAFMFEVTQALELPNSQTRGLEIPAEKIHNIDRLVPNFSERIKTFYGDVKGDNNQNLRRLNRMLGYHGFTKLKKIRKQGKDQREGYSLVPKDDHRSSEISMEMMKDLKQNIHFDKCLL